jgi:hypothetical protein
MNKTASIMISAVLFAPVAQIQTSPAQSLNKTDVNISLVNPSVCVHEPVIISMSTSNTDDSRLAINLGRDGEEYISVESKQPDGKWKGQRPPSRGGFAGLRILRINPQEEKTITFVANKWVGDLAEGEHSLRVMLHVPSTNRNWDPPSDLALAGQIEREFFLNLNVTAPCPGKLAKLADQDLTVIIGSSSVEIKKTASTHLSYISDVVAVPYMERAIIPDAVGNFDIIDGLARIDDERAKDALFRLAQSSDPSIAAYTHQIATPPHQ